MFNIVKIALCLIGITFAHRWNDCKDNDSFAHGPYGPITFHNEAWNDTIFYSYRPTKSDDRKFPLIVFMHGSTG